MVIQDRVVICRKTVRSFKDKHRSTAKNVEKEVRFDILCCNFGKLSLI